mgnify:CR=1 FL=1
MAVVYCIFQKILVSFIQIHLCYSVYIKSYVSACYVEWQLEGTVGRGSCVGLSWK